MIDDEAKEMLSYIKRGMDKILFEKYTKKINIGILNIPSAKFNRPLHYTYYKLGACKKIIDDILQYEEKGII